ncbi:MAG: hypothetical protein JNK82_18845 [Myxococcaceae bacterium]|nr:hypothetical protein [Myxococcaceae bacterium]
MKSQWKAAALVLVSGIAYADDESIAYGIAKFGGAGQCGNPDQTHNEHTKSAAAFDLVFTTQRIFGNWDENHQRPNSDAQGRFFEDTSKQASGADRLANFGADDVDVIYVHTHGGHSVSPAYSSLLMGNASYDCSVRTDQDMLFGNAGGDLDIAVIKACQSADYDTWLNGGYRQQFTSSSSTFTMWNGFHGDSSCGSFVSDYVADYAAASMNNGVGENWLDEAYAWGFFDDDCPASIVMGSSKAARDNMYEWGGFRDRKNTGAKTGSSYYYVSGCNPDNGRKLP